MSQDAPHITSLPARDCSGGAHDDGDADSDWDDWAEAMCAAQGEADGAAGVIDSASKAADDDDDCENTAESDEEWQAQLVEQFEATSVIAPEDAPIWGAVATLLGEPAFAPPPPTSSDAASTLSVPPQTAVATLTSIVQPSMPATEEVAEVGEEEDEYSDDEAYFAAMADAGTNPLYHDAEDEYWEKVLSS